MVVDEDEVSLSNISFNVLTEWRVESYDVSFPASFPLGCCARGNVGSYNWHCSGCV